MVHFPGSHVSLPEGNGTIFIIVFSWDRLITKRFFSTKWTPTELKTTVPAIGNHQSGQHKFTVRSCFCVNRTEVVAKLQLNFRWFHHLSPPPKNANDFHLRSMERFQVRLAKGGGSPWLTILRWRSTATPPARPEHGRWSQGLLGGFGCALFFWWEKVDCNPLKTRGNVTN